jgi:hypothetical protein
LQSALPALLLLRPPLAGLLLAVVDLLQAP